MIILTFLTQVSEALRYSLHPTFILKSVYLAGALFKNSVTLDFFYLISIFDFLGGRQEKKNESECY